MDLTLSTELRQLRDGLRGWLAARYPFSRRSAISASEPGWCPQAWQAFAGELAILGAAIGEDRGGSGGGAVEAMVIMEELGRGLVLEPYLETAVLAAGLLERTGGREPELRAIAAGEARFALAWTEAQGGSSLAHVETRATREGDGWVLAGAKSLVGWAPAATHLLVTARTAGDTRDERGISLFVVDAATGGLEQRGYRTIDGRRAAEIDLREVRVPAGALVGGEGEAFAALARLRDAQTAALAAEGVGVMRAMFDATVAYTGQRRQFGRPLSDFQALQHRMVDMHQQIELAASAALLATLKLEAQETERARAAAAARLIVGRACRRVGQEAIQLHGGMGMTDELPLGHYARRAIVIEGELGGWRA